jgi:hypothetical protein
MMYQQQWHLDRCKIKFAQTRAGLSRFLRRWAKHRRRQNRTRNVPAETGAQRRRGNRPSTGSNHKQRRLGEFAPQVINDGGNIRKVISAETKLTLIESRLSVFCSQLYRSTGTRK